MRFANVFHQPTILTEEDTDSLPMFTTPAAPAPTPAKRGNYSALCKHNAQATKEQASLANANNARLANAYAKLYNVDGKTMTLSQLLSSLTIVEKTARTRTLETHKRCMEYKELSKPVVEYNVWYMEDGRKLGWNVPKIVYDDIDAPARAYTQD